MVEEFLTPAQDAQFKIWLARHPRGYYLNEGEQGNIRRGAGRMILHRVGCPHLGDGEGVISTSYAKAASDDREALTAWALENGLTAAACGTCKPD